MEIEDMNHKHEWRLYKNKDYVGTGKLTFYCAGCLEFKEVDAPKLKVQNGKKN